MANKDMLAGPVTFTGTVFDPWEEAVGAKPKLFGRGERKYVRVSDRKLCLPYHGPHPYGYTGTFHNAGLRAVDGPASE